MSYILNRATITKRIIDLLITELRLYLSRSRLYNHTDVSDRFALEQVQVPCVIIRNVSNTQRRVHFDDFIDDVYDRVELIPFNANDYLYGNNVSQVNLPTSVDWDQRWPWDNTVGYPSGTDINKTVYTTGTVVNISPDVNTGIIVTIPSPSEWDPQSIIFARTYQRAYTPPIVTADNTYTMAIALNSTEDQFFLSVTGTDMTGTVALAVNPNQLIVDGSGIAPGLSGTQIYMNDVLYAGDQYVLKTFDEDTLVYSLKGGIYNLSVSLECFAKSTIEAQELGDLIERWFVEKKLEFYNKYGVSLTSWNQGGQSEREYVNEYLFQTSLSAEMFIEWHEYNSVDTVSSVQATAIPYGIYAGPYLPPGVYTTTQLSNGSINTYFDMYNKNSGTNFGSVVTGTAIGGTGSTNFSGTISGIGIN